MRWCSTLAKSCVTLASSTIAVLDAAIAYGASRWYSGLHQDPAWEFRSRYKAADDKLLFYEFLHDILLYDSILPDRSSVGARIGNEILELFHEDQYAGLA